MAYNWCLLFLPMYRWLQLIGLNFVEWNKNTGRFYVPKTVWLYIKIIGNLGILFFFWYDSRPPLSSDEEVWYRKRDIVYQVEYVIVNLIINLLFLHNVLVRDTCIELYSKLCDIDVEMERLGVKLEGRTIPKYMKYFVIISIILHSVTVGLIIGYYGDLRVRKSLVLKLTIGVILIDLTPIALYPLLYTWDKFIIINETLDKCARRCEDGISCTLCNNFMENPSFDNMCAEHVIYACKCLHDKTMDAANKWSDVTPLGVIYLVAYFEGTAQIIFIVQAVFNLYEISLVTKLINVLILCTLLVFYILSVYVLEYFPLEVKMRYSAFRFLMKFSILFMLAARASNLLHRIYTMKTRSSRARHAVIAFSHKILMEPMKVHVLTMECGSKLILETLDSVVVFGTILITFKYFY